MPQSYGYSIYTDINIYSYYCTAIEFTNERSSTLITNLTLRVPALTLATEPSIIIRMSTLHLSMRTRAPAVSIAVPKLSCRQAAQQTMVRLTPGSNQESMHAN